MSSPERLVRTALVTWLTGLGLTFLTSSDAKAEEPIPGTELAMPKAELVFKQVRWDPRTPPEVIDTTGGVGTYDFGEGSADLQVVFRCDNSGDAEKVRAEFRAKAWLAALAADSFGGQPVTRLSATIAGQAADVCVYWSLQDSMRLPREDQTLQRNEWVITYSALLTYPLYFTESTGTGVMDIINELNGNAVHGPVAMNDVIATHKLEA